MTVLLDLLLALNAVVGLVSIVETRRLRQVVQTPRMTAGSLR